MQVKENAIKEERVLETIEHFLLKVKVSFLFDETVRGCPCDKCQRPRMGEVQGC